MQYFYNNQNNKYDLHCEMPVSQCETDEQQCETDEQQCKTLKLFRGLKEYNDNMFTYYLINVYLVS